MRELTERSGENQEFETDALRALLNSRSKENESGKGHFPLSLCFVSNPLSTAGGTGVQPFEDRQGYRQSGPWFVLAAAVLWGSTGTAQAFAPLGAQPVVVGVVRLVVGGSALLVWAVACGSLWRGTSCPILAILFAAAGMAAYQLCFFAAVATTGVAIGTMQM